MTYTCPRPDHSTSRLSGGPVLYECPQGHSVWDADLDHEFKPKAVTR